MPDISNSNTLISFTRDENVTIIKSTSVLNILGAIRFVADVFFNNDIYINILHIYQMFKGDKWFENMIEN